MQPSPPGMTPSISSGQYPSSPVTPQSAWSINHPNRASSAWAFASGYPPNNLMPQPQWDPWHPPAIPIPHLNHIDYDYRDHYEHELIASDLTGKVKTGNKTEFESAYSSIMEGKWKNQRVAVKVIRNPGNIDPEAVRRRFRREVAVWSTLDHPNVLPLYGFVGDIGMFGGMVSPWCEHGDMTGFLKGGKLALNHRIELLRQVTSGIDFLHSRLPAIVHGDLKPANILMTSEWCAQICDFGLSRLISPYHTGHTTTTVHVGTARYCAPELVNNDRDQPSGPTTESDIYALGCVTLDFIYEQGPYAYLESSHVGKIWNAIATGSPPGMRPEVRLSPSFAKLWTLLESSWSPNASSRPTITLFVSSIRSFEEMWNNETSRDNSVYSA